MNRIITIGREIRKRCREMGRRFGGEALGFASYDQEIISPKLQNGPHCPNSMWRRLWNISPRFVPHP